MHTSVWYDLLTGGGMLAEVLLLVAMLRSKLVTAWPSLFTMIAFEFLVNLTLLPLTGKPTLYPAYYLIYWLGAGAETAFRVWLIVDVARSFRGLSFLPKQLHFCVGALGITAALLCGWYAWHTAPHLSSVLSAVLLYQRAVTFGWLVLAFILLAETKLLNFGWEPLGSLVTTGVVILIITELVSSQLSFISHSWRLAAHSFSSLSAITVYVVWAKSFRKHRVYREGA